MKVRSITSLEGRRTFYSTSKKGGLPLRLWEKDSRKWRWEFIGFQGEGRIGKGDGVDRFSLEGERKESKFLSFQGRDSRSS